MPNIKIFCFVVDECWDLRLIEHWFGGDDIYVNPNVPIHMLFYCTTVPTVVYSNKTELNVRVADATTDGLITLYAFTIIVDFV
jgi:hypothetical protein